MKKVKTIAVKTVPEFVEHLGEMRDAEINENHEDFETVVELAGQTLRVLNLHSTDLFNLVFDGNVYAESLAEIAENTPKIREELEIIKNLEQLYQELRLLKIQGKAYEILDNFFNINLDRTL